MIARYAVFLAALAVAGAELPRDDGYRGIWYYNMPTKDQYAYKYSGGFATYPQQQSPIAIYAAKVRKTFFCYGGTVATKPELLHMVSYYDHRTGMVPRPVILVNKKTDDAHDNPVMSIDDSGYLWIFSNAHGTTRRSYIWRSDRPYSIDGFTQVRETNFSYGHPWWIPGKGFFFLYTLYGGGRFLFWSTSPDGIRWSDPAALARVEKGHYQVTTCREGRVATAFNYHWGPLTANARTNLYYLETSDMGKTWTNVEGRTVAPPLVEARNPALVHDYRSEGLLVYLKTIDFDADGRPVILYLVTRGYESGPQSGPRQWKTARWTGESWEILDFTTSDHNYDYGPLYIEAEGTWQVIAPTAPGPQPHTTGGDMVLWKSHDNGRTWHQAKQITHAAHYNHTYAKKPVNAHPDFYALWADGDTLKPSPSSLYFTDKEGTQVWQLPVKMPGDFARPEVVEGDPRFARTMDTPGLPRVLLIGDSISVGYTLPVRELLRGKANVHRIPANGGWTRKGLANLDAWLGEGHWDVIHFNFGAHDAKIMENGKRQVPLEEYERNLRRIVVRLQQTGARLIWATITPRPKTRPVPEILSYNSTAEKVMRDAGVAINDLHGFVLPRLEELQIPRDAHFTPKGYEVLAGKVVSSILGELRR